VLRPAGPHRRRSVRRRAAPRSPRSVRGRRLFSPGGRRRAGWCWPTSGSCCCGAHATRGRDRLVPVSVHGSRDHAASGGRQPHDRGCGVHRAAAGAHALDRRLKRPVPGGR
jgi:hypothetical protein